MDLFKKQRIISTLIFLPQSMSRSSEIEPSVCVCCGKIVCLNPKWTNYQYTEDSHKALQSKKVIQ